MFMIGFAKWIIYLRILISYSRLSPNPVVECVIDTMHGIYISSDSSLIMQR